MNKISRNLGLGIGICAGTFYGHWHAASKMAVIGTDANKLTVMMAIGGAAALFSAVSGARTHKVPIKDNGSVKIFFAMSALVTSLMVSGISIEDPHSRPKEDPFETADIKNPYDVGKYQERLPMDMTPAPEQQAYPYDAPAPSNP